MTLLEDNTDIKEISIYKLINFINNEVKYNKKDKDVALATIEFLEKFLESQRDLEEKIL